MKSKFLPIYVLFGISLLSISFLNFSSNPPDGRTGAPGDGLCTNCHSPGNPNGYQGNLTITNFPTTITPNTVYNLQAIVDFTAGTPSRAGFQAVILDSSDNNAGDLVATNASTTTTTTGNGREYVEHNPAQFFGANTSVTYTFDWTAPVAANGEVITLYTAGIIASGNSGNANDLMLTNTYSGTVMSSGTPPLVNLNAIDPFCNGGSDGSINTVVSGGTPNYSFTWSNGEITQNISGLAAGTYTVTVTDAASLTAVESITLNEPSQIFVTTNQTDVSCFGDADGTATAVATGGNGNFIYTWSNGSATQTITNLSAGTYTVTASDQNGCTNTASVFITEPAPIITSIVHTDLTCNGINDGTATAVGSGGNGNFTYDWSIGVAAQSIFNLAAGTYTVTVTDGNGCTNTNSVTILEPAPIFTTTSHTDETCSGLSDGTATAIATGGTGIFTYDWSTGVAAQTITNLGAGTYTVTATDSNGCTNTSSVTINSPTAIDFVVNLTQITCNGASDGSATVMATGGSGNYTYLWSTGATTQTISNVSGGQYSITVTDSNGCTSNGNIFFDEPSIINLTTTVTNVLCNGDQNGTASATATGGAGNFSYDWSIGVSAPTITGLSAGTYTVTATDANGCTEIETVIITEPSIIEVDVITTDVFCFGNSDGTATANALGGTGNYIYDWSNGMTTQTISNLPSGTYTITVYDDNQCATSETFTINEPPSVIAIPTTATECGNPNGVATFDLTLLENIVNGGTGNLVSWYLDAAVTIPIFSPFTTSSTIIYATVTDGNCESIPVEVVLTVSNNIIALPLTAQACPNPNGVATFDLTSFESDVNGGTGNLVFWFLDLATTIPVNSPFTTSSTVIYAIVTDGNCESLPVEITLIVSNNIIANATSTNETAANANDGTASANPTGGNPSYAYVWSNGANTSTITGLAPGNYTVTVTDANGCTSEETVVVNVFDCNTTAIINLISNVSCFGNSDGSAEAVMTNGTMPATYLWSTNETTSIINNLSAGTYSCTITDTSGCPAIETITITEPNEIVASINWIDPFCNGGFGEATVVASGGTPSYSYIWSNGATTQTITNLFVGTYTVTVSDANDCTEISTVTITEPDAVIVTTTLVNVSCFGGSDGEATAFATGGIGNYSYDWSIGITTQTVSGLPAGTYTVTATDANGCTGITNVIITEPTPISPNAVATDVTASGANDGTASAANSSGGVGNYTYVWSNNTLTSSINGLAPGNYTVTVTDSNGCTGSQTVTVNDAAGCTITGTIVANNITCAGDNNGQATVNVTSGNPPYDYTWSNGGMAPTITNLSPGIYAVTVTDANNCPFMDTIEIIEPLPIVLTSGVQNFTALNCNGDNNGFAECVPSGGTLPYSFVWSDGQTSSAATNLSAGTIICTVTDVNGCSESLTFVITEPAPLLVNVSSTDETAQGANDGTASATTSGGTPGYTYLWSNSEMTPMISGLSPGTYNVTVTDSNACTIEQTVTVIPAGCSINNDITSTDASCVDANDGTATAFPTGGMMPYTFMWSSGGTAATETNLLPGAYTVTVTDASNCFAVNTVTVNFDDTILPIVLTQDITVILDASGNAMIDATMIDNGSSDNCGIQSIEVTPNSFDCNSVGQQQTVALTVIDVNGNTASNTALVTVMDTIAPTIICPTDVSVEPCTGILTYSTPLIDDNCQPLVFFFNGPSSGTVLPLGPSTVSFEVMDMAGNSASCQFTVMNDNQLDVNVSVTNLNCFNDNSGSATVVATGSNPNFSYIWNTGDSTSTITDLPAGIYIVTVTDNANCESINQVVVTEPNELVIDLVSVVDESAAGANDGSIDITVTGGTPGYTFNWILNGTTISTDEDPTGLTFGSYDVEVVDANGCIVSSQAIIVDIMVGNENVLLENNIQLFPNPSFGRLFLDFTLPEAMEVGIKIYDVTGKVIFERSQEFISQKEIELDVSSLNNGMYFIQVQAEESVWVRKFILQKK